MNLHVLKLCFSLLILFSCKVSNKGDKNSEITTTENTIAENSKRECHIKPKIESNRRGYEKFTMSKIDGDNIIKAINSNLLEKSKFPEDIRFKVIKKK